MLSRLVVTFLPRSRHLLISWLQSPSAVILVPKKIKPDTVSIVPPSICHEIMGLDVMILVFWMLYLIRIKNYFLNISNISQCLKVETIGFSDRLDLGFKEKEEFRITKIWDLSIRRIFFFFLHLLKWGGLQRKQVGWKEWIRNLALDIFWFMIQVCL